MRSKRFFVLTACAALAAVAAGLGGGFARASSLIHGFDGEGLAIAGRADTNAVAVISVAALAVWAAAMLWARLRANAFGDEAELVGSMNGGVRAAAVAACLSGVAGAVYHLSAAISGGSVWGIVNGMLLAASALLMPLILKRFSGADGSGAALSLVPVFWACFRLIEYFREVQATPSLSLFFPDLITNVASLFLFFSCAGCICGKTRASRALIYVIFYIYAGTLSFSGHLITRLTLGKIEGITRYAALTGNTFDLIVFGFCLVCALAALLLFLSKKKEPAEE